MIEPNNGVSLSEPHRHKPKRHNAKLCPFAIRQRIVNGLANGDSKRAIARALRVSNNTVTAIAEQEWQQVAARKLVSRPSGNKSRLKQWINLTITGILLRSRRMLLSPSPASPQTSSSRSLPTLSLLKPSKTSTSTWNQWTSQASSTNCFTGSRASAVSHLSTMATQKAPRFPQMSQEMEISREMSSCGADRHDDRATRIRQRVKRREPR